MMWTQSVAEPEDGEMTQTWGRISLLFRNYEARVSNHTHTYVFKILEYIY